LKIGQKLLAGAVALTLLPVALTAGMLWQGATSLSSDTVKNQVELQLSALRDEKAQQLKDEIDFHLNALRALGANRATVEAMSKFKATFYSAAKDYPNAAAEIPQQRQEMLAYEDQRTVLA